MLASDSQHLEDKMLSALSRFYARCLERAAEQNQETNVRGEASLYSTPIVGEASFGVVPKNSGKSTEEDEENV